MPKKFESLMEKPLSSGVGNDALDHVQSLLRRVRKEGRLPIASIPTHEIVKTPDKAKGAESTTPSELQEETPVEPGQVEKLKAIRMRVASIHNKMVKKDEPKYPTEL